MSKNIIKILATLFLVIVGYTSIEIFVFSKEYQNIPKWSHNQSAVELQKICESIAPLTSYAPKTDYFGFSNGSYFVKSKCYFELAQKTRNEAFCDKVWARYSLLLGSSVLSKEKCLLDVANRQERSHTLQEKNQLHKAVSDKIIKIIGVEVLKLSPDQWSVSISLDGQSGGRYQLSIDNISSIQYPQSNWKIQLKNNNLVVLSETRVLSPEDKLIKVLIDREALEKDHQDNPLSHYSLVVKLDVLAFSDDLLNKKIMALWSKYPLWSDYKNFNIMTQE